MSRGTLEMLTGLVVIAFASWFLYAFMTKTAPTSINKDSYELSAKFDNVDGIEEGSLVMLGGVKIGVVVNKKLDPETYLAVVTVAVNNDIKIPEDSIISITSSGLLGDKFVTISPGGSNKFIEIGGEIKFTQSSVNLETLIGKMVFAGPNSKN